MSEDLSDLDRRLLDLLQRAVPLVQRPYRQLAGQLGWTEEEVIGRVAALSGPEGVIREIAGIFDAVALGYASTLVAAQCRPEQLDAAGQVVGDHPGVSHCYARDGALNLWFTLVVPADSALGLEGSVRLLGRLIGAGRVLSLPVLRRYKLDARLAMSEGSAGREENQSASSLGSASASGPATAQPGRSEVEAPNPIHRVWRPLSKADTLALEPRPASPVRGTASPPGRAVVGRQAAPGPGKAQIRAIRALEAPLEAVPEPFAPLAAAADMTADDLLVHAADFLTVGWMRRYAAVLRHRAAGRAVNVLVAWQVPSGREDFFGAAAAQLSSVSHCYLRRAGAGWPFNLYTMVHGSDMPEVSATLNALAALGDFPHAALATTKEFKKQKVQLFSPDFARWEERHRTR